MPAALTGPRLPPRSGTARQLVVFLHGYGADGNALIEIGRQWQRWLPDAAFVAPTGAVLFTDRRILLAQREHLLEARIETSSWPYRSVRHFSIQEGEAADSRAAVRIWLGEEAHPLHLRGNPGTDLRALQRLLADRLV